MFSDRLVGLKIVKTTVQQTREPKMYGTNLFNVSDHSFNQSSCMCVCGVSGRDSLRLLGGKTGVAVHVFSFALNMPGGRQLVSSILVREF